jgi:hypothetical protein
MVPPASQLTNQTQLNDQAPSLHHHYGGFNTTTSLSAPVQRIDTVSLAGFLLVLFSYHRHDRFPQFNVKA